MSEREKNAPHVTDNTAAAAARRRERLARALRANLGRRKEQLRTRPDGPPPSPKQS